MASPQQSISLKRLKLDYRSASMMNQENADEFNDFFKSAAADPDVIRVASVRPGFSMYVTSIDPDKTSGYDFEIERSPIQFAFCLSGKMCTEYSKGRNDRGSEFINQTGTNSICNASQLIGKSRIISGQTCNAVALQIDREVLESFLIPGMDKVPEQCLNVLKGNIPLYSQPMTVEMHMVASQVFTTFFKGNIRHLYLEAKALELLAIQLDHLSRGECSKKTLTAGDRERILIAGEILIKEMQSPPTIASLSRMVGINEFKLKKGFKQIFGTTVFEYLQHYRMLYARDMIISKGANVSEAADFVGYVNIGHFIACYKKKFGTTPGIDKRENHFG